MGKYVLHNQYSAGLPDGSTPEPPRKYDSMVTGESSNVFDSIASAKFAFEMFSHWVGQDLKTEAEGGPLGWLYYVEAWDGISYNEGLAGVFQYGPRGGITLASI